MLKYVSSTTNTYAKDLLHFSIDWFFQLCFSHGIQRNIGLINLRILISYE